MIDEVNDILPDEEIMESDSDGMQDMYLTFNVGEESYGIQIHHVIQIISIAQDITEMPEMPPSMKGFINLRGNIIPVFSLRIRFNKGDQPYDDRNCIIVVSARGKEIGLIVDGIKETITIEPEYISDAKITGQSQSAPYISGIARPKVKEKSVNILIDLETLFGEDYM